MRRHKPGKPSRDRIFPNTAEMAFPDSGTMLPPRGMFFLFLRNGGAVEAGQSGNPAGRPKGSRNKFGSQFIDDVYGSWVEHGKGALQIVAKTEPAIFIKFATGLLPKEVEMTALSVRADISELEGYDLFDAREFALAFEIARQRVQPEPPMIDLNPNLDGEAEAASPPGTARKDCETCWLWWKLNSHRRIWNEMPKC
jgi:hypothetical protein